jgi:hypothetical protein
MKMAVELGVHCKPRPDAGLIERVAGPLMSSVLGSPFVAAWIDESDDTWIINWGGAAAAHLVLLPRGRHEFGADWFASVAPAERGIDLSLLLAIVVAIIIAVVGDGELVDELSLLGNKPSSASEILVRMLANRERSTAEVLAVLRGEMP